MLKEIKQAADYLKEKIKHDTDTAIILGTGLGSLVDNIEDKVSISYGNIPGFNVSTAPSHSGKLLLGRLHGKNIVVMQGRLHYYEGYTMQSITFPVRVLKEIGIKNLIVTNASGSLRQDLQPGDIVLLTDHINFMGNNPLIGMNEESLGERFPSMNDAYSQSLRQIAERIAEQEAITLKKGVYIAVSGPSLETVSECRAFASWGADVVGMSTVPEVIVAVQCSMKVLGLSIVTNMSNLFHDEAHAQSNIEAVANSSYPQMRTLIENVLKSLNNKQGV